jgi:hypothetical protein
MKLARKKQELVNSALEAPFRRELRDFLRAGMFLSIHPEWVSNWETSSRTSDNIRTCVSLRTLRQAIMINPFPPLNMGICLQQVVESQLGPLLDSLLGYKRIKVKGANVHKTTFITNCDIMPYKCLPSGLFDASIAFERPIHTTFNELVSLHAYLDDLIMCVKGLMITSQFQVLVHFHIAFVLDTNSDILKELQRQLFSYSTNIPHLKYCEGPA